MVEVLILAAWVNARVEQTQVGPPLLSDLRWESVRDLLRVVNRAMTDGRGGFGPCHCADSLHFSQLLFLDKPYEDWYGPDPRRNASDVAG